MMQQDWHPADIIAGLRKKGMSLAALSRQAGLASATLANALSRSWPRGEKIIADALEISPEVIWPSRYFDEKGNRTERVMRKRA
ncbi:helix-turn-helix domain-containing protein [Escherichia sp. 93.0816]|uniref:helix-turn-helix domain-containing protein n=1 Tax=Escherichia sp. 93.0816 TaxID=2723308 RepID=UPI0015944B0F|nr:helix-turn-helix transcriptional regulator [Escherichia sp. 93.0816]EFB2826084.1 transcriptional regulator [Escherichia coli]MBB2332798.1 helix-turn-helix domain-containing protein [Escherichia sp. 93.0816]